MAKKLHGGDRVVTAQDILRSAKARSSSWWVDIPERGRRDWVLHRNPQVAGRRKFFDVFTLSLPKARTP